MGQMAYMAAMARLLSNFSFKLHPEVRFCILHRILPAAFSSRPVPGPVPSPF